MDRRKMKTRRAVFTAFEKLLSTKRYRHITVQDILDEADVGRSTFYAHFETKDDLLNAMCAELFDHVFESDPPKEAYHDFSKGDYSLEKRLAHMCHHLYENRAEMLRLLSHEGADVYYGYFSRNLKNIFFRELSDIKKQLNVPDTVPDDFLLHQLSEGIISALRFWVDESMKTPPEAMAKWIYAVNFKASLA